MVKKRVGDCTFKEFIGWCNMRACDGAWSMDTAIICIKAVNEVYKVKPLFGRKKAREKKWKEIRAEYFNLDAEIEV